MGARRGPHVVDLQEQPPLLGRAPDDDRRRLASTDLHDRLAALDRHIQSLLLDNQRLAAVHVALRQELLQSHHHLRHSAASASRSRDAKEADLRDALERSRHAEAAARQVDAVRSQIARLRDDVRTLSLSRDEMVQALVAMRGNLGRMRAENTQLETVAKEIDAMQRELHKGRAAIEFEKKAHAENEEQRKQMETTMASMACEIEKLRADLANADKTAQAAAANPGYPGAYANPPEAGAYGSHADPYMQAQVQRMPDGTAQYVPASGSQHVSAYNTQPAAAQR
ncbi:protein FLC EXPRESSOR [Rhynchospora pubera]|uniref:Protein FLC EXPRESSOR n=1 Tax=Rhynchospora pubera TaxID=906938 RepID=A0AAV8G3I6_9POAL|nr:protein FLC EXPRESSOR [Rhynchospora pubera]KAJ4797801.1 protein FLC EXPRESSOR [Rhynchospora pubera]